jgi:hypothetical protein
MRGRKGITKRGEGDVLKGLAAGLVGGLIASWTMNRFQDLWNELARLPSLSA